MVSWKSCFFIGHREADERLLPRLELEIERLITEESVHYFKVNAYDAFQCEMGDRFYLCWTISPEISCVIEYNAAAVLETDICKMAESVQPPA